MKDRFDVAIIGSGFAGSILGWILAKHGRKVALVDAQEHPRFAIGESSTPLADKLLRRLGERYDLPELVAMSTYGSWQTELSQIGCGRKRGFSYYQHERGEKFHDEPPYRRSLLVAASRCDESSDTHWYRAEVDEFLFQKSIDAGAVGFIPNRVVGIQPAADVKSMNVVSLDDGRELISDFVVDASGSAQVLHHLVGTKNFTREFRTRTACQFAHFRSVGSFHDHLSAASPNTSQHDPFHCDDAAQHHLVDDGWIWMLRMNNGVTSVGWVTQKPSEKDLLSTEFQDYSSLADIMSSAERIGPPGSVGFIDRTQRWADPGDFPKCWMLPTAAATIDPLHSIGIGHAMLGVWRIIDHLLGVPSPGFPAIYRDNLNAEVRWLDQLVATAYQSMKDFERFSLACALFFISAIACEESIDAGDVPEVGWNAGDRNFRRIILECLELLQSESPTSVVMIEILKRLEPINPLGLGCPRANHRYAYTATK